VLTLLITSAELSGGAIAVYVGATAELTNITVDTAAAELGGALAVDGTLTCTSCHFTHTTGEFTQLMLKYGHIDI
jgi:hypothetical protein